MSPHRFKRSAIQELDVRRDGIVLLKIADGGSYIAPSQRLQIRDLAQGAVGAGSVLTVT